MKINKYNSFIKEDRDEWDDSYNSYDDNKYNIDDVNYDEDDDDDDDMEHLLYLLRKMFNGAGINNVEVTNKKMDLTVYIELKSRERLRDIIKIFEVVNKLKKDILVQYDSEFDMWSTRKSNPILTFSFYYYDDDKYDDYDDNIDYSDVDISDDYDYSAKVQLNKDDYDYDNDGLPF